MIERVALLAAPEFAVAYAAHEWIRTRPSARRVLRLA